MTFHEFRSVLLNSSKPEVPCAACGKLLRITGVPLGESVQIRVRCPNECPDAAMFDAEPESSGDGEKEPS